MVIIKEKELSKVIESRISKETHAPQKTDFIHLWRKLRTPLTIAGYILIIGYMLIFSDETKELITWHGRLLFRVETPSLLQRVAAIWIFYIGYLLLYIIVHELIHIIFSIDRQKATLYISIALPFVIGMFYDAWVSKKKNLLCIIAPTVIISVLIIPLFLILPPYIVGLMLLFHLTSCGSDIFSFFHSRKTVPDNCMMYGDYYKPESVTEDV